MTEKDAIKNSIKHWEKDILARFGKRDKVITSWTYLISWKSDGTSVNCSSDSCPLCEKFVRIKENGGFYFDCEKCPLGQKYGGCNSGGPWLRFYRNPTKKNCERMIEALKSLLEAPCTAAKSRKK